MKGPGQRIRYDVRRVWQCPQCGAVAKTAPQQVALECVMHEKPVWMKLLEPPEQVMPQTQPRKASRRKGKKPSQAAAAGDTPQQPSADTSARPDGDL